MALFFLDGAQQCLNDDVSSLLVFLHLADVVNCPMQHVELLIHGYGGNWVEDLGQGIDGGSKACEYVIERAWGSCGAEWVILSGDWGSQWVIWVWQAGNGLFRLGGVDFIILVLCVLGGVVGSSCGG